MVSQIMISQSLRRQLHSMEMILRWKKLDRVLGITTGIAEKDDAPFDGGKPFIPQETAAVTATTATAETDTSEEYSYFSKLAEGN